MIIYLDILIIVNLFVNYFLILATKILIKSDVRRTRIILTAIFTSLYSLLIFVPQRYWVYISILKIPMGILLVLLAFGYKSRRIFIKTILIFLTVNVLFGGVIFLVYITLTPQNMLLKNGILYMNINPLILVIGTTISYFVIKTFNLINSKRIIEKNICDLEIEVLDKSIKTKALVDSGNQLTDPFLGLPVVICEFDKISKLIPDNLDKFFCEPLKYSKDINNSSWKKKIKLIPCDTIAGNKILPAFKPQRVSILKGDIKSEINVLVAITPNKVSDGEYSAIIGNNV